MEEAEDVWAGRIGAVLEKKKTIPLPYRLNETKAKDFVDTVTPHDKLVQF